MESPHASLLKARDLRPLIGTEIQASKDVLLSGKISRELRELLAGRSVLVFPQIHFSDEEQRAFTQTLGTIEKEESTGEEVFTITLDSRLSKKAAYLRATFYWHLDGYQRRDGVPNLAGILSSKVLGTGGGDTEFCNTYASYDALSDTDKEKIDGLKVVHSFAAGMLMCEPEVGYETWQEWSRVGRNVLPLVWKHRSGRKSLIVGATASHVVGLDPLESRDLLIRLRDWATQPQFVYSHKWQVGDAVLWDNTGALHRVTPYDPMGGRLLRRTKLAGEEAFG